MGGAVTSVELAPGSHWGSCISAVVTLNTALSGTAGVSLTGMAMQPIPALCAAGNSTVSVRVLGGACAAASPPLQHNAINTSAAT